MNKKDYFHIEFSHLGDSVVNPFHIYVYNSQNESYSTYLYSNSPFDGTKRDFLLWIESRGGQIAILKKQQKTFLRHTGLTEEDIPDLQEKVDHELEIKQNENLQALERFEQKHGIFHFKEEVIQAVDNDNFMKIIERSKSEIMTFSPKVSPTVSLATFLAENLLTEDNDTTRAVAFTYQMAKTCKFKDEKALSDIICAAFFSHLGHSQVRLQSSRKPQIEQFEDQKKDYKTHPGLSTRMLKILKLDVSSRVLTIIEQHHERYDGSGYPYAKQGDKIEPLALVLGASFHLLEFSRGAVATPAKGLDKLFANFSKKTQIPGLEMSYGETVENIIASFVTKSLKDSGIAA